MLVQVVLLLLPAIVYGDIFVRVKAGKERGLVTVEYSGSIVEIVPDKERETWQINDEQLKYAAELFSGGRPSDVFFKSPTPWNDLYKRYGWNQVQRTLIPKSVTIRDMFTQPVIVTTQELVNNGTVNVTYIVNLQTQTLSNDITSTWENTTKKLEIKQENTYNIEFDSGEVGDISIQYKSTVYKGVLETRNFIVGSNSSVSVELQPGQSVIATLTATRRYMEVQVDYEATLSGDVACNYGDKFKGHSFWSYDINDCLEAAKLPMFIETSETIEIGFYTDANVTVIDKASHALIAEEKAPLLRNFTDDFA